MLENNKAVKEFLDSICRHVRAKELHPEIREEISGHIVERAESLQMEGYTEESAIQEAVKQMGSASVIGRSLHQAHRPLLNWRMSIMIVLMSLIGLFGVLNVEYSEPLTYTSGLSIKKAIYIVMGLLVLIGFYFLDYRKIRKYSEVIFSVTLALMAYTLWAGDTLNGAKLYISLGFMYINMMELSVFLLLIALAGLNFSQQDERDGMLDHVYRMLFRGVVPILLFIFGRSMNYGLIYIIGYLVLTWQSTKKMKHMLLFGMPTLAVFTFMMFQMEQVRHRIAAFFNPTSESNFQLIQTMEAIRSAGWTGHGFAATHKTLPYILSDSLFPYLIYCFGWGAAIVIVLLVLLFLIELWRMSTSRHDLYAKRLTLAFMVIFGFFMLWPILMAFGIVPITSVSLPFMAYGGWSQFFYFAAVGMLLSMYRRKNMVPRRNAVVH
ncbi:FtsW/RodA/SpoVE family cell cycle protein [Paenibacillus faecalis]|uniref:FtsW/RodA/SpoVE family cell cycle protein n=1 Tax=Paenibacillus faecalis TaxID=2079532 RepID=UPI001F303310|nr:FtsW/RodA/SpoVE family cell cycle protein [Paenibacillus faecalis]